MTTHYCSPKYNTYESDGEVVCSCCENEVAKGELYVEKSVEVRYLAGNNIIDHDHETTEFCEVCGEEAKNGVEYDPYDYDDYY